MAAAFEDFGTDHWTTFAYIAHRCIDYKGQPENERMRCDEDIHPGHRHHYFLTTAKKYPTILHDGKELYGHDDWSCLDDFEEYGYLQNIGSGLNRRYRLTNSGWLLWYELQRYISENRDWSSTFVPQFTEGK